MTAQRDNLKEKLNDTEHRAQNWGELCEKTFEFASQATPTFQNGTLEEKRTILETIGANLVLKDRKLNIQAKKHFLILTERGEKVDWWAEEDLNL